MGILSHSLFFPKFFIICHFGSRFVYCLAHHLQRCESVKAGCGGHTLMAQKLHYKGKRHTIFVEIHSLGLPHEVTMNVFRNRFTGLLGSISSVL